MASQTEPYGEQSRRLLQALGDPEGYKVAVTLLRKRMGVTKLAKAADVSVGNAHNMLAVWDALGLVRRDRPKGPWRIEHRDAVFDVLDAADRLADLISTARLGRPSMPKRSVSTTARHLKTLLRSRPPTAALMTRTPASASACRRL